nr:immunoglobulin heavy chain junction region [Mus musculus]
CARIATSSGYGDYFDYW